jgi:hypothetical protein
VNCTTKAPKFAALQALVNNELATAIQHLLWCEKQTVIVSKSTIWDNTGDWAIAEISGLPPPNAAKLSV